MSSITRKILLALLNAFVAMISQDSVAETTAPLAEWQYSSGVLFDTWDSALPSISATFGATGEILPRYEGASSHYFRLSPFVDIRYRESWFASTSEGVGVNIYRTPTSRGGAAITWDFGREADARVAKIDAAPELKGFYEIFVNPIVLRVDLRRALGGSNGWLADVGAYAPIPLTEALQVFLGPSFSLADHRVMRSYFGASNSGDGATPATGLKSAILGASVAWEFKQRWLLEGYGAYERLIGAAARSPTARVNTFGAGVSLGYEFDVPVNAAH